MHLHKHCEAHIPHSTLHPTFHAFATSLVALLHRILAVPAFHTSKTIIREGQHEKRGNNHHIIVIIPSNTGSKT
jgi:hypothetical protein